jgi:hypothetical protein
MPRKPLTGIDEPSARPSSGASAPFSASRSRAHPSSSTSRPAQGRQPGRDRRDDRPRRGLRRRPRHALSAADRRRRGSHTDGICSYEVPWGMHRSGSFRDPFGHTWHIGDHSPLQRFRVTDNRLFLPPRKSLTPAGGGSWPRGSLSAEEVEQELVISRILELQPQPGKVAAAQLKTIGADRLAVSVEHWAGQIQPRSGSAARRFRPEPNDLSSGRRARFGSSVALTRRAPPAHQRCHTLPLDARRASVRHPEFPERFSEQRGVRDRTGRTRCAS